MPSTKPGERLHEPHSRPRPFSGFMPGVSLAIATALAGALLTAPAARAATPAPPPPGAGFDYQIGGGYPPPAGV